MATENSGAANLRPSPPGKSGNPGGRPKSFAHVVREKTAGGEELIGFALDVLRGKVTTTALTKGGAAVELAPALAERLRALDWLTERGWGRPVASEDDTAEIVRGEVGAILARLRVHLEPAMYARIVAELVDATK